MDKNKIEYIRDKFIKGMQLTVERLLQLKSQSNDDIIISDKGKITRVKAKDLMSNMKK